MITTESVLRAIREHGVETYPEECCGLLLGDITPDGNRVSETRRIPNRHADERARRYLITPEDYHAADREARRRGLDVVGIYHSHPDAPARPSATDLAQATFPGLSYVIVSIRDGKPAELTNWTLASDRTRFEPEDIDLNEHAIPEPTPVTPNS
jgi:proteasome lid subunit RPN8/RPN11